SRRGRTGAATAQGCAPSSLVSVVVHVLVFVLVLVLEALRALRTSLARPPGLDLVYSLVHPFPGFPMASLAGSRARQLSLPFEEAPLWDGYGLEAALLRETSRPLRLTLTQIRSVLLSYRRKAGVIHLRLHRMFLHAPLAVVRAVARSRPRGSRSADSEVRRFMNENLHRVRKVPRQLPPLLTSGRVHDLQQVFDRLNVRFFENALRVPLTWG